MPGAASNGSVADGAASWRALMRDKSLQFNFPDASADTKPPGWLKDLGEFLGRHSREIHWAGWALLAILVALALWFLVRKLKDRRLSHGGEAAPRQMAPWQPGLRQARLVLQDADGLAAQGRFDEAVHLLLLVSIQEIGDRQQGLVTPALTSREIAALPALTPLAQGIFSGIAQMVEHSRFGGHAIGDAEYQRCRAGFDQFTEFGTWRMAA
ncbi:MAG: hypothetical protein H0U98_00855 [Alphaproteobacteria bacterium]|nr:hypothetical protein [Alphaproteobacteria bacterium]